MWFKIYRDFEYVWGTCDKTDISRTLSKSQKDKRLLPINIHDWRIIRGSNGSVLKYHQSVDAIKFTSASKTFEKIHKILARTPSADLRYAIHWDSISRWSIKNNKHFNYIKPKKVSAIAYKGIKYIMLTQTLTEYMTEKSNSCSSHYFLRIWIYGSHMTQLWNKGGTISSMPQKSSLRAWFVPAYANRNGLARKNATPPRSSHQLR